MAAPWNPPVKNEDFVFRVAVESYANPGNFQSSPTIAAGASGATSSRRATTCTSSPTGSGRRSRRAFG